MYFFDILAVLLKFDMPFSFSVVIL